MAFIIQINTIPVLVCYFTKIAINTHIATKPITGSLYFIIMIPYKKTITIKIIIDQPVSVHTIFLELLLNPH